MKCARQFDDYKPISIDEIGLADLGVHLEKLVHED